MEPSNNASLQPVTGPDGLRCASLVTRASLPGGIAVLAALCGLAFLLFITRSMQEKRARFSCVNNLSQLGGLYAMRRTNDTWAPRSGPALFLAWRVDGTIRPGDEAVLVCPLDDGAVHLSGESARTRYASIDLDHPPDDLCSYAVRDFERFPLDAASHELQVLAVCVGRDGTLRHKGGVNVLYDNGSARFVEIPELEELGLPPGAEPVPGPDSPCSILRVVRFGEPAEPR